MIKQNSEENNHQTKGVISVVIADDHHLVRHALNNLIGSNDTMKVIGEASNGKEAISLAKELMPDVIIMDIGMPVMNGLEATRQIKVQCPKIAILVLTIHTDKEHILGILQAGAAGYLTKEVFGNDVIHAIQAVVAGEAVLTQSILQQILSLVGRETVIATSEDAYNLTDREISILKLAANGWSNKNIALNMNLSENTIKSYFVDIFRKIKVGSRTEAVITGLKAGFLKFSDLE